MSYIAGSQQILQIIAENVIMMRPVLQTVTNDKESILMRHFTGAYWNGSWEYLPSQRRKMKG